MKRSVQYISQKVAQLLPFTYIELLPPSKILERIETVFKYIISELAIHKVPVISWPLPECISAFDYEVGTYVLYKDQVKKSTQHYRHVSIKFGTCHFGIVTHIARLIKVMEHLYQRIKMNSYGTKREVYYNDTQFFLNQLIVDTLVSQVELILGCCRNSFHISPSPRGQIFGSLVMKVGGIEINYLNYNSSHGQLMPCADDDIEIVECTAKYIIIVEKDTIFHRLLSEYCDKIIGPHILMTAKGYPDYNTRMLLRFLNEHLFLPVLYFGDCDPFGIDIFTLYAFGSNVYF